MEACLYMSCNAAGNFTDPKLKGKKYCEHHRRVVLERIESNERFDKAVNEREEIRSKFKRMLADKKMAFELEKKLKKYSRMDELKNEMLLILEVMENTGFDNGFAEHSSFIAQVNSL